MNDIFQRLAPYIQDYIYANHWEELRDIQKAACRVIWDTDDNLLLSSGTASGKTEAAFLPVLTELYRHPAQSVGVLYISPLKALINDQFKRLDQLLLESGLPVCKWHGDASRTEKERLVKHPQGILQITPESLESLLIRKRGACYSLFHDLRFVIIDEVHYFMRGCAGRAGAVSAGAAAAPVRPCAPAHRPVRHAGGYRGRRAVAERRNAAPLLPPRRGGGQRKIRLLVERFEKSGGETAEKEGDRETAPSTNISTA